MLSISRIILCTFLLLTAGQLQAAEGPLGPIKIALKSNSGNYVTAPKGGGADLEATATSVGQWECYELVALDGNKVALKAFGGKFVTAENGGNGPMIPNRDKIGPWETFEMIELDGNNIALKAVNGMYVRAEKGGGGKLRADREKIDKHETFTLIKLKRHAIRSHNGQYLSLNKGNGEVKATAKKIGEDESFEFVNTKSGVVIKANNGKYLQLDDNGAKATAASPDAAETFTLASYKSGNDTFITLKTSKGMFLTAVGGGGFSLKTEKNESGEWETFSVFDQP